MFAVGHMALAYLLGKPVSKLLKTNLNLPLLFVLSIIPDGDLLLIPALHRGPTHSIITALLLFLPFFIIYRKKAIPYFLGLTSHFLIADFLIGGQIMLFWPLTQANFGLHEIGLTYIDIKSPINIGVELTLFLCATFILFLTRDFSQFLKNRKPNLILIIPIFTVLLPSVIGYPLTVPLLLIPAHWFYLILFLISVLIIVVGFFSKIRKKFIAHK